MIQNSQFIMAAAFIIVLALTGLGISAYFTLAYYGRVKKTRWVPEIVCAPESSGCVAVLQTPYARVFGVPNSLLGIAYYTALLVWSYFPRGPAQFNETYFEFSQLLGQILVGFSVAAVLVGFYLIYALRRKLRVPCALCYTAHAVNAVLLVLLVLQVL